jgi:hypothetical protein
LHEIVAAAIAAVIVVMTLYMMVKTFDAGGTTFDDKTAQLQRDAYERRKDVMLYALSLLGTVTGYYLGRVPAERRADSAQAAADSSQKAAAAARTDADVAQTKAIGAMEGQVAARRAADAAKSAAQDVLRDARTAVNAAAGHPVVRTTLSAATPPAVGAAPAPEIAAAMATLDRAEGLLAALP